MQKPTLVHVIVPPPSLTTPKPTPATTTPTPPPPKSDTALQATTTECPPNTSVEMPMSKHNNNLLRKLASSHYQSYTTALTVTIAVGCFLLFLNILIFAGIYHQRDKTRAKSKKDCAKKDLAETGSCSSSSAEAYDEFKHPFKLGQAMGNYIGEYSCEKRGFPEDQMPELPLQQFKSSPPPGGGKRLDIIHHDNYPPDVTTTSSQQQMHQMQQTQINQEEEDREDLATSPSIPEPPPPPKNQPPTGLCNQSGILRSHPVPATPGTMKKRVQIQEISV